MPIIDPVRDGQSRAKSGSSLPKKREALLIYGFSEIVDPGDTLVGGERVAGFMETYAFREWLLPLSAKRALSWKTAPVTTSTRDKVAFVLSVGFGNGSPLSQPSGCWDVYCNDRFALSLRVARAGWTSMRSPTMSGRFTLKSPKSTWGWQMSITRTAVSCVCPATSSPAAFTDTATSISAPLGGRSSMPPRVGAGPPGNRRRRSPLGSFGRGLERQGSSLPPSPTIRLPHRTRAVGISIMRTTTVW